MVGSMLEIVFFSLALGYKFRVNYLEKERQQKLRNEISSNLHDDLSASLSSLTMYSELSKRKNTKEDLIERFDVVALRARDILSKVREAVYDINPKNDEDNAWFERIVAFGREIFEIKNIDFRAEVSDDFNANKIPPQFRRDIFLIFKEAMNNAAKYSEANTVVLIAHKKDGKLILSLKDDGIGFMTTAEEDGNGIRNMRDRAAKIQADFILKTEKGTEITLKW
jgi:signal transduction histidine kinase